MLGGNTAPVTATSLMPGDHIYVSEGLYSARHGIYVGYQGCVHWVVYVEEGKIIQSGLDQFLNNGTLKRAQYTASTIECIMRKVPYSSSATYCYSDECNDIQTIVRRALSAVEDGEHSPYEICGESFAYYCRTGKIKPGFDASKDNLQQTPPTPTSPSKTTTTKAVAGSALGAGIGFVVGGPVGGLIGGALGAGIAPMV